jgi:hypothetical protein
MDSKGRRPRTSKPQQETYVKFLEDNPNFASGILSDAYSAEDRERDWNKIVKLLNGCPGAKKEPKQWEESFYAWKSKLTNRRRRAMARNNSEKLSKADELTDLDIRALKALGKWTGEISYNNQADFPYDNGNTTFDDDSDQTGSFEMFQTMPKTETFENPMIVYPDQPKKRKLDEESPETSKHSKIIEENTKAIRNHTAALMTLSDSISSLTSTIRSYIHSRNLE